jgi:hypothetical protein
MLPVDGPIASRATRPWFTGVTRAAPVRLGPAGVHTATLRRVRALEFDAIVEGARGGGALVALPADAADVLGAKRRVPVVAWFNEIEYRGSTMPTGGGSLCIGISKAVRAAAGVGIGDAVHVRIETDDAPRTIAVPGDLADALAAAGLTDAFASLSYTHRREHVRSVEDAKRPETRARRIEQTVTRLAQAESTGR